jgi:broad specificity phosphatase PhoE
MARLYLIRHAEPSGSWAEAADAGLSLLGHDQAKAAAERLKDYGGLDVVASPLRRARETAAPYAIYRRQEPAIAEAVAEIPTPSGVALENRGDWLQAVMAGSWAQTDPTLRAWRAQVVAYLIGLRRDTAIFSHFIAINVAIGAARRDDRVVVFSPAHASITAIDVGARGLEEIELGAQAQTVVR